MVQIVPEHVIRKYAFEYESDDPRSNIFTKMLEDAKKYKAADLEPVFIYNNGAIGVTSVENINKMYH